MNNDNSPGKLYYTISEVCSMVDLPASVLRYWETEFSGLKPQRNKTGKRLYRDKDIEQVRLIKMLLHEKRFTIEGAKRLLKSGTPQKAQSTDKSNLELIEEVKQELRDILDILDN